MAKVTQWTINGRIAVRRDLMEALALTRQHRKKVAQAGREARERDAAARAVAASIRRQTDKSIGCRPRQIRLKLDGTRKLTRLEARFGLAMIKRTAGSSGGASSFHFKLTARGLGAPRKPGGRQYRRGEILTALTYILRLSAREDDDQGLASNIALDPDALAAVLGALEELELDAGRENANVYMSLIVSLPAELNAVQRKDLLGDICGYLDEHGLGYVGIQHKPDRDGDQRNYHAHILFSWRPMAVTPNGCAFAAETLGALNTPDFIIGFRAHAADAMNVAMRAAGHERRFTAERTRTGPGSSVTDKDGAGRKHRDRRSARIAAAERQKAALADRQSALLAAINIVQRWAASILPDRQTIMATLRERQDQILSVLADRQARSRAEATTVKSPSLPIEREVSHAKPVAAKSPQRVTGTAATPFAEPMPAITTPPSRQALPEASPIETLSNAANPVIVKENDHAHRSIDAARLIAVRQRLSAREPDDCELGGEGQARPLASLPGLSTLGLAGGRDGTQMLLHGVPSGQLGEAAGRMGGGDGVRRPRTGDQGADQPADVNVSSVPPIESHSEGRTQSSDALAPTLETTSSKSRAIDTARANARRRDKVEDLVASKERMDQVGLSISGPGKADVISDPGKMQPMAPAPMPAVAVTVGGRPGRATKGVKVASRGNGIVQTLGLRDHAAESSSTPQSVERVDLERLQGRLRMFTLPLRDATIVEEGRERSIITVVVDKAVPEDADLAAMAEKHQTSVIIQEVLQRQFDLFLMHVRNTLMVEPNASADRRRELLDPKDNWRLRAALAAAAGSPSFLAIIEPDRSVAGVDELFAVDQAPDQHKRTDAGRE